MPQGKAEMTQSSAAMTLGRAEVTKKQMGRTLTSFGLTKEQGLIAKGPDVSRGF